MGFGALLRRLRAAAGLSQAELGARVHYSKNHLSCVERGVRALTKRTVQDLDDILDGHGKLLAAWYDSQPSGSAVAVRSPAPDGTGSSAVTDTVAFAAAMEQLKRASGRSYRDIAKLAGLPKSSVHDLCRGNRNGPPSAKPVKAFLHALDVDGPEVAAWLDTLARVRTPTPDKSARLRRDAESGDPMAMHRFAEYLRALGEGRRAERWYRLAAEADLVEAMIELGTVSRKTGDFDTAAAWWMRAASAGNATAMNHLALLAAKKGDPDLAEHWYRNAAGAGSVEAMHNLALICEERGQPELAEYWYGMAAKTGDDDAMENLAAIYRARGDLPKAGMMKSLARRHRPEI